MVNILSNEQLHERIDGYLIFWLVVLSAFAVVGLRGYELAETPPHTEGTGPYGSSDALLKKPLSVPDASQKLTDAFAQMPPVRPVAMFFPANDGGEIITFQVASYLAWPREVWSAQMDDRRMNKAIADFSDSPFTAILFYNIKPPAPMPGEIQIGPALLVAPLGKRNP